MTVPAGTPTASTYASTVLADDPDYQWRLGETSGTIGYDRSGSNDLTLNSANNRNVAGALLNDSDPATNFPGTSTTVDGAGRVAVLAVGPADVLARDVGPHLDDQRRQDPRLR